MTSTADDKPQYPECQNCRFFDADAVNSERRCKQHDFVMPRIDWQIVCTDWQHDQETLKNSPLEPGTLYYYSYASGNTLYAPIAPMSRLQSLLISVSVRQDNEYGWIIFPRQYQIYFPPPDSRLTLVVDNRRCAFQVATQERRLAAEMVPTGKGKWEAFYHMQQVYMLYSLESPDLLFEWLNSFMDVEAALADSLAPSLPAFIEIRNRNREYVLHADLLNYGKYLRDAAQE